MRYLCVVPAVTVIVLCCTIATTTFASLCGTVCSGDADCANLAPCTYCAGLVPSSSWSGSQDDGRCSNGGPSPPSGGCNEYCSGNDDCDDPHCPYCNIQSESGGICNPWPSSCGGTCQTAADCHKDCLLCSGTINQPGYCYSNTSKCFGPCHDDNDCGGGQCSDCNNVTNTCVLPSFCGTQCTDDDMCSPIYGECTKCDAPPFSNSWGNCIHTNETVPPGCHQPCKSSADCAKEGSTCPFCWGGMCHKPPKCGQPCYEAQDCSQYGYCEACSYNQSDASSATGSSGPGKCYNPWHLDP